jgi:hypothetical protein
MSPEDCREYPAIKRRMEFLELRASHLWKYRQANIERGYADVKTGRFTQITNKEDEQ